MLPIAEILNRDFTPTYSSWLNLVERSFAALETKQLRRGVHDGVRSLESAIRAFIDASNTAGEPYVWTKTTDEILASIARFALRDQIVDTLITSWIGGEEETDRIAAGHDAYNMKLAIVDDDEDVRRALVRLLRGFGHEVRAFGSVLNLVLNACDAMSDTPAARRQLAVATAVDDGFVRLAVSDNGIGIPADRIDQVFEPFVTFRPQGLGLGLAISRSIVSEHRGTITAENNADGGATFRCVLPRAAG